MGTPRSGGNRAERSPTALQHCGTHGGTLLEGRTQAKPEQTGPAGGRWRSGSGLRVGRPIGAKPGVDPTPGGWRGVQLNTGTGEEQAANRPSPLAGQLPRAGGEQAQPAGQPAATNAAVTTSPGHRGTESGSSGTPARLRVAAHGSVGGGHRKEAGTSEGLARLGVVALSPRQTPSVPRDRGGGQLAFLTQCRSGIQTQVPARSRMFLQKREGRFSAVPLASLQSGPSVPRPQPLPRPPMERAPELAQGAALRPGAPNALSGTHSRPPDGGNGH